MSPNPLLFKSGVLPPNLAFGGLGAGLNPLALSGAFPSGFALNPLQAGGAINPFA